MKNIISMMLLVVCLGISVLAKAQQAKEAEPQLSKKEIKTPAAVNQPAVPQTNPAEAAMKSGKATLVQKNENPATGSLTPEQAKTLNGTVQKPEMVTKPGTEHKTAKEKPARLVAPAGQ